MAEAAATHNILVRLIADPGTSLSAPITVLVADALSGTAESGHDYTAFGTQSVTFDVGAGHGDTRHVTLQLNNDLLLEGDEHLALHIISVTGPRVTPGTSLDHEVTIVDDERVAVEFSDVTSSVGEAAGTYDVQVRLVADPGVTLAVPITAQVIDLGTGTATSGSDYAAFGTQTVTFEIGSGGGTERSVTLTAIDDDLVEGAENVNLQLGTLTGPGAALGAAIFHEVVIGDDDQNAGPPLAIVDIVVNDGSAQRSNIETISIRFNQATNLQQLIDDSQIASAVQLFGAAQTQIS